MPARPEAEVTLETPISRRVIEQMADADLLFRSGVGVDHIDLAAATEQGLPVANVPGAGREAVASHVVGLLLAAAHDIAYADRALRTTDSGWGDRTPLNLMDDGTFGIIGVGRVGRAVVEKARGFGMEVIATDPYVADDAFDLLDVERTTPDDLLARSECVSIHAPHTAETEGLLSTPEFRRTNDDAVLVNTARGPVVAVDALVDAVANDIIHGAGLDVFPEEPPTGSPALDCENIVCSPHHAGISPEVEEEIYRRSTEEICRVLRGDNSQFVINPSVFQHPDGRGLLNPPKGPYDYT